MGSASRSARPTRSGAAVARAHQARFNAPACSTPAPSHAATSIEEAAFGGASDVRLRSAVSPPSRLPVPPSHEANAPVAPVEPVVVSGSGMNLLRLDEAAVTHSVEATAVDLPCQVTCGHAASRR